MRDSPVARIVANVMRFAFIVAAVAVVLVADQASQTLTLLDQVERERDTWQRRNDLIHALDLKPGESVIDFGSGAGYFALRLAPTVGPTGQVTSCPNHWSPAGDWWLPTADRTGSPAQRRRLAERDMDGPKRLRDLHGRLSFVTPTDARVSTVPQRVEKVSRMVVPWPTGSVVLRRSTAPP